MQLHIHRINRDFRVSILIPCEGCELYIDSVQTHRFLHRIDIGPTEILHRPHIIYRNAVVSTKALHTLYSLDTDKLMHPKHRYVDIGRAKENLLSVISIGYLGISLICL